MYRAAAASTVFWLMFCSFNLFHFWNCSWTDYVFVPFIYSVLCSMIVIERHVITERSSKVEFFCFSSISQYVVWRSFFGSFLSVVVLHLYYSIMVHWKGPSFSFAFTCNLKFYFTYYFVHECVNVSLYVCELVFNFGQLQMPSYV